MSFGRDLLSDLTTAGNFEVPAASPPSNKREREEEDDESQQSVVIPPSPIQRQQRSSPMNSSAYPELSNLSGDSFPRRASMQITATAPTPASSLSSSALASAIPSDMSHSSSPYPPPCAKDTSLLPKPYQGSYIPLGGSSGLGSAVPIEPTSPPRVPTSVASFGRSSPLSPTARFASPPTIASDLSMGLGYDMSRSTSASTSATTPNSPLNGPYPAMDFGAVDGVFETPAGGGYGEPVPVAYKEAMLRHFAPVLQDDGQIGVDQDTMMMWSTMPSTYECVFSLEFMCVCAC